MFKKGKRMKKYSKLFIIILLFIIIVISSKYWYQNLSNDYSVNPISDGSLEAEENDVRDFVVVDENGEERTLQSFIGKPIVLNFWASWCPPCKAELPDFQDAYEKYGTQVEFVMVNLTDGVRETEDVAKDYMNTNGYTLPVYFDINQDAVNAYSIYSIPTTYFINKDGEMVTSVKGMIDSETLEEDIKMMLQDESK